LTAAGLVLAGCSPAPTAHGTTTTTTTAISLPRKRYTLTASTTIYLDGQGTFSAGGEKIFGTLTARRAR